MLSINVWQLSRGLFLSLGLSLFSCMVTASSLTEVMQQAVKPPTERLVYGPDTEHFALHWLPNASHSVTKPELIFIHGGCWLSEYDHTHADSFVSDLADRGFSSWSIEYRRSGITGGGWPVTLEDVISAIQAIRNHSDKAPVTLIGHSAGGHLALLAGLHLANAGYPVSVIGLGAITDPRTYALGDNSCQKATPAFMGGMPEAQENAYDEASVVTKAIGALANVWLLHGADDTIVPTSQAQVEGTQIEIIEGVGHFDWLHIDSRAHQALLNRLNQITADAPL